VPAVNPFIDTGLNIDAMDGSPVIFTPDAYTLRQQDPRPGALAKAPGMIGQVATGTNAAGTSENVAMHVAIIVALSLLGIYMLRQSGFKFVAAGSIG
jgi:hypothetical protein